MSAIEGIIGKDSSNAPVWNVEPRPAFCVKFKDSKAGKFFINFCVCDEIPAPVLIDEDKLAEIIDSNDPGSYRIPLSVSDLHIETDKSGDTCTAVDVIINRSFFENQARDNELFKTFTVLVAVEAIQNKHSHLTLDRENWTVLKNRKHVGDLQAQNIRQVPKRPLIQEIKSSDPVQLETQETETMEPPCKMINRQMKNGRWGIDATFQLRGIQSSKDVTLDVTTNRMRLSAGSMYLLELELPVEIETGSVSSDFDRKTGILTVVLLCPDI